MKFLVSILLMSCLSCKLYAQEASNPAIEELKLLSIQWMDATVKRDAATLNRLVAPEFKLAGPVLTEPALPRELWMKNTMENLKIDSVRYISMSVDVVDDVAIVRSEFYWSYTFRDMPAKQNTVTLVDTWLRRNKAWQVVSRIVVK